MQRPSDWSDRKKWVMGILGSLVVAATVGVVSAYVTLLEPDREAIDGNRHPDRFVGTWENENPETDSVTRIQVESRNDGFWVGIWGSCPTPACFEGPLLTPLSDAQDGTLTFDSKLSFKESTYSLTAIADGRVRLSYRGKFIDGSGRLPFENVQYFVRKRPLP